MKSNFSSMKFVAMALLMACFTMGYAQCDQGNIYGQRGQKTGFAIVFADSNGQEMELRFQKVGERWLLMKMTT